MFIEQAYKGKNDTWRVILTVLVSTAFLLLNMIMFFFLSEEEMQATYDLMKEIPNNISLAMNLGIFVFLLGALFFMVFFVHQRSLLTLTTNRKKVDFKRILFSFGLITVLTIAIFAISYSLDSTNIIFDFKPVKFLILIVISLLLFPFQIGYEEYLFRGYLMQQLGILARNRWFPLLVTSVAFGLMHSANPEVAELGYGTMIFYIGTGLLLGVMTLMDEGMELALGFHFGNNFMAATLVSVDFAALQTDALFIDKNPVNKTDFLGEMILSMVIIYPLILLIFSKKYKWKDWKEKLFGKVHQPDVNTETIGSIGN